MSDAIVYQNGNFFVKKERKGYAVYQNGAVAATRRSTFGSEGAQWLKRAIERCDELAQNA